MRKLTLVLSGAVLLLVGSCSKEEFKPNPQQDNLERTVITNDSCDEKSNSGRLFNLKFISDSTIVITDPNRDEDEERKVKRK